MTDDPLVSLAEAAAYLHVSTKTVIRRVQDGSLKARKVGRQWRFEPVVLRAYDSGPAPIPEVDAEDWRAVLSAVTYPAA